MMSLVDDRSWYCSDVVGDEDIWTCSTQLHRNYSVRGFQTERGEHGKPNVVLSETHVI